MKNRERYGQEYRKHVEELRIIFQQTIRKGKDLEREQELDQWMERASKAKHNIEQVLLILQDFVHFDRDIETLKQKLEQFKTSDKRARPGHSGQGDGEEEFDLLLVYRKIKIMLFLKDKMQGHPELSQGQRDQFRVQFSAIDDAYTTLETTILEILGSLVTDLGTAENIARANPSLIVKIVRIMEFESHFEKSLRSQGAGKGEQEKEKTAEEEEKISPMEQIKSPMLEPMKGKLRIKGAQAICTGVEKMLSQELIDLDRNDVKKFDESMKVSLELIGQL